MKEQLKEIFEQYRSEHPEVKTWSDDEVFEAMLLGMEANPDPNSKIIIKSRRGPNGTTEFNIERRPP